MNSMTETRKTVEGAAILESSTFNALYVRGSSRLGYRHHVRELPMRHALHGVQHRSYSRSRVTVIGGAPHVKFLGELREIVATEYKINDGLTFLADFRLKGTKGYHEEASV